MWKRKYEYNIEIKKDEFKWDITKNEEYDIKNVNEC